MNALPGTEYIIEFCYLIASALFIFSLKWMSSPATARRGIMAGEIGMVLAIGGTLLQHDIITYKWIFVGLALGTLIGIPLGMVQMTAVPQRTALSHAFGALCVTLVGTSEFYLNSPNISKFTMGVLSCEVILGGLTFTGSLMAAGKLQEVLPQRPITYKGQNIVNFLLLAVAVVLAVMLVIDPSQRQYFPFIVGIAVIFGVLLIIPIGGADMPTVISLLNGYAGLSAAAHGFRRRQQVADHRRRARRIFRPDSLDHHVEGDEPVVHERALRRVRPGTSRGGSGRGDANRPQRKRGRSGTDPEHRAVRGHHSRATEWRLRRRSTRFVNSSTRSPRRASMCVLQSTRWPDACRVT